MNIRDRLARLEEAARRRQQIGTERITEIVVELPADAEHPAGEMRRCEWGSSDHLAIYEVRV